MAKSGVGEFQDIQPFLRPKLRLFLSADLVGSTKLKQSGFFPLDAPGDGDDLNSLGPEWFSPVANFYLDFESQFANQWVRISEAENNPSGWAAGPAPRLWKTNGDEILYVKEIQETEQIHLCIEAWLFALKECRKTIKQANNSLDIKGTAWLAGFPVANHEIVFRSGIDLDPSEHDTGEGPQFNHLYYLDKEAKKPGKNGLVRDYIGPSIDTGFRLAAHATPRQFPISLETAFALSSIGAHRDHRLTIHFGGKFELKGVLGGKPYPIFWIDTQTDNRLIQAEDMITAHSKAIGAEHLRDYCDLFITENEQFLFKPFIDNCSNLSFRVRPPNYDARLRALNSRWLEEKNKFELQKKSVGGGEPPHRGKLNDVGDREIKKFAGSVRPKKTGRKASE